MTETVIQMDSPLLPVENLLHVAITKGLIGESSEENCQLPNLPAKTREEIEAIEEFIVNPANATALVSLVYRHK